MQGCNSENNSPVQHLPLVARLLTHSLKITPLLHGAVYCLYQGIEHSSSSFGPRNAMLLILFMEDLAAQGSYQLLSYLPQVWFFPQAAGVQRWNPGSGLAIWAQHWWAELA